MMPSGAIRPEVCWSPAGMIESAVTASPAAMVTPAPSRVVQPVKAVAVALSSLQSTTWPSTLKCPGCSKLLVEPTLTVTPLPSGPAGTVTAAVAVVLPPSPTGSLAGRPASGSSPLGVSLWTIRWMPSASPLGRLRV